MYVKRKTIIHAECGKRHIDKGKWAKMNHSRHLCEYCKNFFFEKEKAVGF